MNSWSVAAKSAPFAILYLLSSILVLPLLPGCLVVGTVAHKLSRPDPVPAKYTLAKAPTLVLVESYDNPSSHFVTAQRLTSQLSAELERNEVVPLADIDLLYKLRDKDDAAYRKLTIPQIARAVGAKQVVYVNIQDLTLDGDGNLIRGTFTTLTRVIDADTGRTQWPSDFAEGYPLTVQTPAVRAENDAGAEGVRAALVRNMADATAKLFYTWRPVEGIQQ